MSRNKHYNLSLGVQQTIGGNMFGGTTEIAYTGSPSPGIYSVALIRSRGNNSYAYTIYFREDQQEILIRNIKIYVLSVDERHIEFSYRN